jgi:protein-L-isoaspartate(D-aspartate) O-methyltransferase
MANTVEDARRWYAEEIREIAELRTEGLVAGLARVPREAFLGPGPWLILRRGDPLASRDDDATASIDETYRTTPDADPRRVYHNVLIAIDPERFLNNGQPSANLQWIDALEPEPGDRVMHVGAGVGYYTAVLAEAVGPTGRVLAIEADDGLAARATANLATWPNVRVVAGDGSTYDPGEFDVGYVNCGATKLMPAWLDNIAPGGRLHVPLTCDMPQLEYGFMLLVHRSGERWPARFTSGVAIYPCSGARDDESHAALAELIKKRGMTRTRSLRRDAHAADDTCLMHQRGYCLSTLPPGR